MKQTQGVFFTGYVTIKVTGHHPELFFDLCARNGITVWNIRKVDNATCTGNVKLAHIRNIRALRRKTIYKLSFVNKKGLPFLTKMVMFRRPLVIGLILSMLFVFFLSNVVWDVKIKGVPLDIEKKITTQLQSYGIKPGAFKFNIGSPGDIQQKLLDDIPELLWVGVSEKGTTYHLEGVEKTTVEEKEKKGPRNLVATKEGEIVKMFVSKGQPIVKVHDVVHKGDLLVSGELGKSKEEEEDESKEQTAKELVAAEGEIIAKTWYETEVIIPLEANYEVLTGENKKKYYLGFGDFLLPVWGFFDHEFDQVYKESSQKNFHFLKWELPISFVKHNIQEKEFVNVERTNDEAKAEAIKQSTKDLQEKLGHEAEITFEKVLHETIDNGKVKLTLYFTVLEDIAKPQPLSQGD
ncbi:sporulation protein YqfD [Aquibacillus koreensis]|uniref:Sporulation protein YqfD n=1 Tax=Aquibacillus koreensis TaxID=279446 RepID=A0A9X3WIL3_9BACI|nr:sporulation protein YqfD [Aquibacillus koreensis]MCT2537600.1 sporulation protein YqfD [Aquibacillus koreensis]MDC3419046.1 sporulation protein YqfD [Aquibacillus koreensis]